MEREMCYKLYQIRQILDKTNEPRKGNVSGHNVGIFSALKEEDVTWLHKALSTRYYSDVVKNVTLINISDTKGNKLEKIITEYTFCIYISNGHKGKHGTSVFEKEFLSILGKKNLILVIDDQEDGSDEGKNQILSSQINIRKFEGVLFLFSKLEKESGYRKMFYNEIGEMMPFMPVRMENIIRHQPMVVPRIPRVQSLPQHQISPEPAAKQDGIGSMHHAGAHTDTGSTQGPMGHNIGIFSRSVAIDYSWLVTLLKSEDFRDHVIDVRSCLISNKDYEQFTEDVHSCTFGILYHTKTSGRVNITDGTDSLYDDELEYLHNILGKMQVFVVIDDLLDSSDDKKTEILLTQRKIKTYANDLILISQKEKYDEMGQLAKRKIHKMFTKHEIRIEEQLIPSSSGIASAAPMPSRSIIGIFSRSEEGNYSWLRRLFINEDTGSKDVRSYMISSDTMETIRKFAFHYKFAVLYTTKKNEKMRNTDAQNPLEQMLEILSAKLGKQRVIMVIDDLDDSSSDVKFKILKNQPCFGQLAADIFLFTAKEKKYLEEQNQETHSGKRKSASDKIQRMKETFNLIK
ncbi:uncharacterized protein LOC142097158 [Mixophyes fleayi]|uniref:uncharacterized protein LOC142097158 n=1 Tax=Mixophyes fleayi TaxID=3061075 RepID=UPI003F4DA083